MAALILLTACFAAQASPATAQDAPPADDVPSDEELLAMMSERPQLETGTGITGRVVDGSTGEAIIEGAVVVVELGKRVYTNIDGYFAVDVPPGTYTIRSFYELFQPTRVSDVVVTQGEATDLEIELSPDTESVEEELVVTARADTDTAATQLQIRRQSSGVRDAISAEEISRSPDSAASDAARRVVAATIVGGQYLYVRGLGGRYTNVLLNGAQIPSLDPDVPGVQLDMFPANMLSSLSILKTYSPDLPASFGGGTMLLETRDFPDDFEVGASLSLGYQSGSTFADGLGYEGGGLDWLGFDDGTRALPDVLDGRRLDRDSFDRDEREAAMREFPNRWSLSRRTVLPDMKIGFDVGDRLSLGNRFLGYLVAVGYGRSSDHYADQEVRTVASEDEKRDDLRRDSLDVSVLWSALGTATLEVADGQELTLTTLYNQSADDYAAYQLGFDDGVGTQVAARRLRWVQRGMWFSQLSGDHRNVLEGSRLRWRFNTVVASRSEPDTRDLVYQQATDGDFIWFDRDPGDGQRLYSGLSQLDFGGAAHLESPLLGGTVKVGGAFNQSDRSFEMRRFELEKNARADPALFTLAPEDLFAPSMIPGAYRLSESTVLADGYDAQQDLYAAFVTADIPVTDWLRISGGVRAESFRQVLIPSSPFAEQSMEDDVEGTVHRTDVDVLPAASLVFQLRDDMNLRAAYSATVARPQIRELSESLYPDFVRRRNVFGDPTLQRTRIQNLDLRWELFPGETEVVAASLFAKLFDQPIELVILDANYTVSSRNVQSARNLGAEAEVRLSLGRIDDAIEALSVGGNLTLVLSQAQLTPEQAEVATSDERPLAGQSPYVANLSLGFAPPDAGFQAFLYYNVFGRRIEEVGFDPLPDTYQQPFHSLDLVFQWDIDDHLKLKGAVKNILFDDQVLRQGDVVVRRYDPGLSASVQLGWSN